LAEDKPKQGMPNEGQPTLIEIIVELLFVAFALLLTTYLVVNAVRSGMFWSRNWQGDVRTVHRDAHPIRFWASVGVIGVGGFALAAYGVWCLTQ
jgi:hypothetical protein